MNDLINGLFELGGGIVLWLNVWKLYKDKQIKGVHWTPVLFFGLWGYWNLYYYPSLDQWFSFWGGVFVTLANTVWFIQMVYYLNRKRVSPF